MGLFENLFHTKQKQTSAIVIDLGTDSVAGAYVVSREGEAPALLYAHRDKVTVHHGESHEAAAVRTLSRVTDMLVREGAAALGRHTGSGRADHILLSIDAPWQKARIRVERLEKERPFIFTEDIVRNVLRTEDSSDLLVDERLIGAVLNGYETGQPYGKKASSATLLILTTLIEKSIAGDAGGVLRRAYHTDDITVAGGSAVRLEALCVAFPHEQDALIVDATGAATSIGLIRRGLIAALAEFPGTPGSHAWTTRLHAELGELAKHYPLPRTVFLLASEHDVEPIKKAFNDTRLVSDWLSNVPKLVPVQPPHLSNLVRHTGESGLDMRLLLLALYPG